MKEQSIYKYELNENIAAEAAMNCIKKRNKPQQINESKFLADILRVALFLLRPLIKKIVQSLITKFGAKLTGRQVAKMVIKNVSNGKTIMKIGKKVGQTWTKIPPELKQEIAKSAVDTWKEMRAKKAEPQDAEQKELAVEQEEGTLNAYYSQDEPDYENDHHGIWLIINLMRSQGMLRAQGIEGRDDVDDGHAIDKAYDLIEQKLNDEGMWIGDDDHEAERFVSFFGEEIAEEAMKSAIHNQEQEELPSMERHDMILTLTQYLDESWIDANEDGDLEELYYAVAKVLDKTGDYPASTSWEDCKPWCQKHWDEVEETFLGGSF